MRKLIVCIIGFSILALGADISIAQETPNGSPQFIANVWTTDKVCNYENSQRIRFRYLLQHRSQFEEKCVIIKGYYRGRALYLDLEDLDAGSIYSRAAIARRKIGVLAKDEYVTELYEDDPQDKIEIVGKFTSCEKLEQDMGGFFMGSYCHYTGGPVILVASYRR